MYVWLFDQYYNIEQVKYTIHNMYVARITNATEYQLATAFFFFCQLFSIQHVFIDT